jgi:beta-galactosidase
MYAPLPIQITRSSAITTGSRFHFSTLRVTFIAYVLHLLAGSLSAETIDARERILFTDGWRFYRSEKAPKTDSLDYFKNDTLREAVLASAQHEALSADNQKIGADIPFTQAGFDDSNWQKVNLPHDWAIAGPFQQDLPGETGKLPWVGVGWYRKTFSIPESAAGKQFYLDIDGAMSFPMVWCNGRFVGGWPYGYSSIRLNLTSYLKPGAQNVLAIRIFNEGESSRWYPGAGIYRNVWLVQANPVHVGHWGITITTPEATREKGTVCARIELDNTGPDSKTVTVQNTLYKADANGKPEGPGILTLEKQDVTISGGGKASLSSTGKISNPELWSIEHPTRYVLVTDVTDAGKLIDRCETVFGFRTIAFSAESGFSLNGKKVMIKGVCNHHDLGALGAAFNTRAAERQLELLKEMGANALRTSHNPPAPELLDLCDRMGILVMDEAFDCWKLPKKPNQYSKYWDDWHETDLRAMVRRDRNHPSIICWSIGNEVLELKDAIKGPPIAQHLSRIVREEDATRPTVLGSNQESASYNGIQKSVDVMGQNYQIGDYSRFRKENPDIPLVGSETSSVVSSRGEYFFPVTRDKTGGRVDFQVSSYDLYAPPWAYPPDFEFEAQAKHPFVAGEFVWTGFDYLGEPTPYNTDSSVMLNFHDDQSRQAMQEQMNTLGKIEVPSRSSYFGILDLAGFKKDRFWLYQSQWCPELPVAHILPHWNWPERIGQTTPVHVYTSGDEAELFLNGESQGRKVRGPYDYRLCWDDVRYQPGELKVVAYKKGRIWATKTTTTTGPADKLAMKLDKEWIYQDGKDLVFVTVEIQDKSGKVVPRSKNLIEFEVEGPGEIVAVDNGDPTSLESFHARQRKAFNGLALVILRALPENGRGDIVLRARSSGLTDAVINVPVKPRSP